MNELENVIENPVETLVELICDCKVKGTPIRTLLKLYKVEGMFFQDLTGAQFGTLWQFEISKVKECTGVRLKLVVISLKPYRSKISKII